MAEDMFTPEEIPDQEAINEFILMLQMTTDLEPELLNQVALDGFMLLTKKLGYCKLAKRDEDVCPECKGKTRPNKVTYTVAKGYCVDGRTCPTCQGTGKRDRSDREKVRAKVRAKVKYLYGLTMSRDPKTDIAFIEDTTDQIIALLEKK